MLAGPRPRSSARLVNDFASQAHMLTHTMISKPMRIAWFSPLPPVRSGIADVNAELLPRLERDFVIERFDQPRAHDFVWRNLRAPYDLVVYQLGNASCHDFIWAYLARFPGL